MLDIKDTQSFVKINISPATQKKQCKFLDVEMTVTQDGKQVYGKSFQSISGSRNDKKFFDEFNQRIKDLKHILSPNKLVVNTDRDMLTHLEYFSEECMSVHKIKLNNEYCKFPKSVVLDDLTIAKRKRARDAAEVQTKVYIDIKPLNTGKENNKIDNFESYNSLVVSWSVEQGAEQISKKGPVEVTRYIRSKSFFDEYNTLISRLVSLTDEYNLEVIANKNLLKRLELLAKKHLESRRLSVDEDFCKFPQSVVSDTVTTDNENRMFSM